ncbi:MAG: 30S ribosomal protein S18 [Candidatus Zophobacter franzmannii]|jgi:small subunit ribosomal protein S18|nr:30S ribosomal protein S18 [Candidatus Zophobacter franzmannii]
MTFVKRRKRFTKKRVCAFCKDSEIKLEYKNYDMLRRYINEVGKIEPARLTGTCAKHQRKLSGEIKRARQMALIPYIID